jgi:lipopolysaccharide cholinephosphotransferase
MNFPDEFFQDEYRCDFLVPELMKRAWAAEMEILEIVDYICQKYNLQYFADYGTLLGAVRHQGFIPWDDDIDITLKRNDYNILISVLPKELPKGFVIDGLHAPDTTLRLHTNIAHTSVKTDPSYWSLPDHISRFHGFPFRGTFIDIFPLDYIPRDPNTFSLEKNVLTYIFLLLRDFDTLSEDTREAHLIKLESLTAVKLPRNETTKWSLFCLLEAFSSMFDKGECDELDFCFRIPYEDKKPLKKEWYDETIRLPFEGFQISAPKHYHEILTAYYEDYKTPVKFTQAHDYPFYQRGEQELTDILAQQGFHGSICDFVRNIDSFHIIDSNIK